MSTGGRRMALAIGLGLAAVAAAAARADPKAVCRAELSRCISLAAADERLACYDSLARPAGVAQPASAGRVACEAALRAEDPVAAFGVEHHQVAPPEPIQARVVSVIEDRQRNVTVQLDNGQAWAANEPDAMIRQGDQVTIRPAALGSFLLMANKRSYRVHRLQ